MRSLVSPGYLERLNAPSAWSVRMMPHHRNMVRSQCHVLETAGATTSRHALTIRLSPQAGRANALRDGLRALGKRVAGLPGLTGMHVLRHEAPAIAVTEEQRIRGLADRFADWVIVTSGYDLQRLRELSGDALSDASLAGLGAAPGMERGLYALAHSALPSDVEDGAIPVT